MAELTALPSGYPALLEELKVRIRAAQLRAALTLNQETILLYWSIGQDLSSRFAAEGWGTKVVDRLAKDLGTEFPGVEGFSLRNLRYMRSFAEAWPDSKILQLAAKLPWGHHMVLLDRLKDGQSRDWYLRASIEYGWSRNVLTHQISTQLREREGKALTNFARTLPEPDSDLTQQIQRSLFVRVSYPEFHRERTGARARAPQTSSRPSIGAGPRILLRRQPGAVGDWR